MVREKRVIPKWQIELFEAWANAGFPDHLEYTIKRGKRWGCPESVETFPEIAKWWREQFQKEPPKLPHLPKRKTPDDIAWGSSGKEARLLAKFPACSAAWTMMTWEWCCSWHRRWRDGRRFDRGPTKRSRAPFHRLLFASQCCGQRLQDQFEECQIQHRELKPVERRRRQTLRYCHSCSKSVLNPARAGGCWRIRRMAIIQTKYQHTPTDIPLRVPLGKDFAAVTDVIPELEGHLKERYPTIREVSIRFRNPAPPPNVVANATYLHDASLVLGFKEKTVAGVIAVITQEAIDFVKQRVKRIRPGRTPSMRGTSRRKEGRMATDTPIPTICPHCRGKGNINGMPEKTCDTCEGTGMVSVEDLPSGADLHE